MRIRRNIPGRDAEKGVTMIEQVMAALFIGFLILVWVNSMRVGTKGTIQSKNNLRAQNLGMSKLEDVKNTAIQASYGQTWASVTQSAVVVAYRTPQVAVIEGKAFTWQVNTDFVVMPNHASPTAQPQPVTYRTRDLGIHASVHWLDVTGPKSLTMTGYATDLRP